MAGRVTSRKMAGHVTSPKMAGHVTSAIPHTDFQFYCSETKNLLSKWCKKMRIYKKKKSQCEWRKLVGIWNEIFKNGQKKMSNFQKSIPNTLKKTVVTDPITKHVFFTFFCDHNFFHFFKVFLAFF